MARICHTNKCPVGVATQQEGLRKRFPGLPEHVVNFFLFIAEEVRQLMSVLGIARMEDLIGRTDLLEPRTLNLAKTKQLDLSSLLNRNNDLSDRSWLTHNKNAHSNGYVLENEMLKKRDILEAIKNHGEVSYTISIVNTDRSVCARISGAIASQHGNKGFQGKVNLIFKGAAGQSFGAFLIQGMNVLLIGEANDYVGKGINGGMICIIPPIPKQNISDQVILGNTCLYGATGGKLFALGKAGERFAVRNSGVSAVVEGVGDHCCEYMTGGIVVVLGSTGRNIGAGMTGGVAFLLDDNESVIERVNKEIVEIHSLSTPEQESILKPLLEEHLSRTKSSKARQILSNWMEWKMRFKVIVPPSEKSKVGLEIIEKVLA